jgi:excisionase family DNA binding protein
MSEQEQTERVGFRVKEVARALGIGLTRTRELIQTGRLPCVRIGRTQIITVRQLQEFVLSLEAQAKKGGAQ